VKDLRKKPTMAERQIDLEQTAAFGEHRETSRFGVSVEAQVGFANSPAGYSGQGATMVLVGSSPTFSQPSPIARFARGFGWQAASGERLAKVALRSCEAAKEGGDFATVPERQLITSCVLTYRQGFHPRYPKHDEWRIPCSAPAVLNSAKRDRPKHVI